MTSRRSCVPDTGRKAATCPAWTSTEGFDDALKAALQRHCSCRDRRRTPCWTSRQDQAVEETDRATYQAMEALIHNLNTMHSRAGAQMPFSSINYGTDTSPEGRMVMRNVLLATEAGLGNGETPIFPIQIFKVKEGVNYNPGDPNYDLFQLACQVSAPSGCSPTSSFMDAPVQPAVLQARPSRDRDRLHGLPHPGDGATSTIPAGRSPTAGATCPSPPSTCPASPSRPRGDVRVVL